VAAVTCIQKTVQELTEKSLGLAGPTEKRRMPSMSKSVLHETAFGCPRDFLDNRFVYTVVSPRARGLSVGVNINPDKFCDFDCLYCEVDRRHPARESDLDVEVMAQELKRTLLFVQEGHLRERAWYRRLPDELLQLRHVALSGDGEPTLSAWFAEALQAIVHVRALGGTSFFKLVLITNASGLDRPEVLQSLKYFTRNDEIWAKLDGGTQAYVNRVNRGKIPLEKTLANILLVARQRPVVIQSLFPALGDAEEPPLEEIEQYAHRLLELKNGGAQIPLVQIYSATRPTPRSECGHLPLKVLSRIAQTVRQTTGLKAEVF
jgi:wyosine [tRNA(Phe)-imidazoG37] synthetase (radical SAM superfamily)